MNKDDYCPVCDHDFCICNYEKKHKTERQELIDLLDTNCGYVEEEEAYILADRLIRHGYRKQSDTIKEFVDKLIENLEQYVIRHFDGKDKR